MKINVSIGEIIDRYTILQIKMQKIEDASKLNNIRNEFDNLTPIVDKIYAIFGDSELLYKADKDLYDINLTIWNIKDQIRQCESDESFGEDFIELARSLYINNDERTDIKKLINLITDSK